MKQEYLVGPDLKNITAPFRFLGEDYNEEKRLARGSRSNAEKRDFVFEWYCKTSFAVGRHSIRLLRGKGLVHLCQKRFSAHNVSEKKHREHGNVWKGSRSCCMICLLELLGRRRSTGSRSAVVVTETQLRS